MEWNAWKNDVDVVAVNMGWFRRQWDFNIASWIYGNNVVNVWIADVVYEFGRKEMYRWCSLTLRRFRVSWHSVWVALNVVWIAWNASKSYLNGFGIIFECMIIGVSLNVWSYLNQGNIVELWKKEIANVRICLEMLLLVLLLILWPSSILGLLLLNWAEPYSRVDEFTGEVLPKFR